ncbi:MAG: RAMP superfamily CRISPR-associated protein [Candidatus Methylacidiphilales bacterium]
MSEAKKIIERECTIVLELLTPLHIGTGEPDGYSDAGVVRDCNGLPGIPGTSIQGMLRAAVEEAAGEGIAKRIFGYSSLSNKGTGRGGRLSVSWGVIHDQNDTPVTGWLTSIQRDSDPVLRDAARPMLRDHVRLNDRGVAESRGKFDELVVSAGHHFTVRLRFITSIENDIADEKEHLKIEIGEDSDWHKLVSVLNAPRLRLGGKTRRGLGSFKINWKEAPEQATEDLPPPQLPEWDCSLSCKLTADTLWMLGGGSSSSADSAPVRGTSIGWTGGGGRVQKGWIITGSSIKGALAHRTRFHANRLGRNFAGLPQETDIETLMSDLFGTIAANPKPGKVFIDDLFIPESSLQTAPIQNHVAINPFTGGAKDSALFNDQPLPPGGITIPLSIHMRGEADPKARRAFEEALRDLKQGRLALGAHSGRGYGIFKST